MIRNLSVRLYLTCCLVLFGGIVPQGVRAETPAVVSQVGQRSTAMVHWLGSIKNPKDPHGLYEAYRRGTAFCITRSGYFVTAAHVLEDQEVVQLTLQMGPRHVATFDARVDWRDRNLDLAILKAESKINFVPIDLSAPATITRGMHVTAFGFPVSDPKEFFDPNRFYQASVGHGHVLAINSKGKAPNEVVTDSGLGPGASGGPIVNDRGQLVGILQKGRKSAHVNLCKAANVLLTLLANPKLAEPLARTEIEFSMPDHVSFADMALEQTWTGRIRTGLCSRQPVQADLRLSVAGADPRVYHSAIRPDGSCEFHAPLFPPRSDLHTVTLFISGSDASASISCQAQDRSLTAGNRTFPLSDVARIDQGTESLVVLKSGELIHAQVSGLEALQALVNGQAQTRDLHGARRIVVRDSRDLPSSITYSLAVTQAGRSIGGQAGRVSLDVPPKRLGQPILIISGTPWATNSTGLQTGKAADLSPSTIQYIHNVAEILTGGAPSRILIESDHWTLGVPFQEVLRAAGHTVTVSLDPGPLDQYDAVFIGGHPLDERPLIAYLKQGGKVYISGGMAAGGHHWTYLLNEVGLTLVEGGRSGVRPGSGFEYTPLFAGVQELNLTGAMHLLRMPQAKPDTQIVVNQSESNVWAIYRGGEKLAPETPVAEVQGAPLRRTRRSGIFAVLDRMSLLRIMANDARTEGSHHLLEEKSTINKASSPQWRAAEDGGWFSYEIQVNAKADYIVDLLYLPDEMDNRGFDLTVDGVKLTENPGENIIPPTYPALPGFSANKEPRNRSVEYLVPPELTDKKERIVVRLQAHPGKSTGRITTILISGMRKLAP